MDKTQHTKLARLFFKTNTIYSYFCYIIWYLINIAYLDKTELTAWANS